MSEESIINTEQPEAYIAPEPEKIIESIDNAIELLLKDAIKTGDIRIGANEVIKAIESKRAHYVFLAADNKEENINNVVRLLAKKNEIEVIDVPQAMQLGEWCGLCKLDINGQPRNIRSTSCAAILSIKKTTQALTFLKEHIKSLKE